MGGLCASDHYLLHRASDRQPVSRSAWSVSFAIYNLKHETESNQSYGSITDEEMLKEVKSAPWLLGYQFTSDHYPTLHHQTPTIQRDQPLNLVIVLEESLGATFEESLGGRPVTPRLEALKNDGWWFEDLYATGTRSVRGIEAVISGFLPSASRSVVKLSLSQTHFFTLAGLLERKGYDTGFIYGGEAHFDNMRSFFSGNGFQHIADEADYLSPVFTGSWGVSDEDLFNNAVKYADHALGEFIATARQRDYWKNTVVLIVADHDARVWGDELVPTLLSLMGIESDHPMIGRDLTQHPDDPGRAIMQFNDNYAWMTGSGGLWRSHSCRYGSIRSKLTTCPI